MNSSLTSDSNYPPMSDFDWERAPWNQHDPEPNLVEVTAYVTLKKEITLELDEDISEYSDDDLKDFAIYKLGLWKNPEVEDIDVIIK